MERKLAAILAADVVGYSQMMARDEAGTLDALNALRAELFEPKIAAHRGRTVKLMGDGMLIEFPSVVEAVECAVEVQREIAAQNGSMPLTYRMGVNLGDVIVEGDDIHGDGVNIAARLEGLSEPGGVCISLAVWDQIKGKTEIAFADCGAHEVKNIPQPVSVWMWTPNGVANVSLGGSSVAITLPDKPSIAVLPFTNLTGDVGEDYFADGVADDIITGLSRFRSLFVIARNSSFAYKGQSPDIRQVAADLGVRYVLEGSVRKAGDRVRISAQLIDGSARQTIWADRLDGNLEDVFDLQDEITGRIASAIEPEIYAAEGAIAERKNPGNLGAWDLFLQAKSRSHIGTKESNKEAEELARQALNLDKRSVGARKLIAHCLYQQCVSGWTTDIVRTVLEARNLAEQAVQIDPGDAQAYQVLGLCYLGVGQFDEAKAALNTAVELNPNFAQGFVSLATYHSFEGDPDEALSLIDKAIRFSPRDANMSFWRCNQSLGHLLKGEYDSTIECAKFAAKRKDYWAPARWYWAAGSAYAGEDQELEAARAEVLRLNPNFSIAGIRMIQPFKHDSDFEIIAEGLRKAGFDD